MKYKFLLILFLFGLISCGENPPPPKPQKMFVLLDYTEGQSYDLKLDELMRFTNNVNQIILSPITDSDFQKTHTMYIEYEHTENSLINKRRAEEALVTVSQDFILEVSKLNGTYGGKEQGSSNIINPIRDAINNATDGDYIFVFSDLLEYHNGINFRKMNSEEISSYLSENLQCKNIHFHTQIESFRSQDDVLARKALEGWTSWGNSCNTFKNHSDF